MKLIDIWVVYQGGDDRSCGRPTFFYTDHMTASRKAHGSGWYGGDAHMENPGMFFSDEEEEFRAEIEGAKVSD